MNQPLIFLLLFHLILSMVVTLVIRWVISAAAALSFISGAGLVFANLVVLVVLWTTLLRPRFLGKKLVALSIGVIVFKFAILGWILNVVVTSKTIHVEWFALGVSLVLVSVVAAAIWHSREPVRQRSGDDRIPFPDTK